MSRTSRVCRVALLAMALALPAGAYAQQADDKPDAAAPDQKQPADTPAKPDAGTPDQPKPKPATRPATRKSAADTQAKTSARKAKSKTQIKVPASAMANVQDLKKEYELGKLRRTSDFLNATPNAEMTPEVIMALLTRRLGSSDSMDGYIKWQLLSGLPAELPEQFAPDAATAYLDAPGLQIRPGMTKDDKKVLDRDAKRVNNAADLTAKLVNETRRVDLLNEPVISYREGLFAVLPDNAEVFRAALKDIYQRGQVGITPRTFLGKVTSRIIQWATTAQNMNEIKAVHGLVDELAAVECPEYYDTLRFNRDDNAYVWDAHRADVNDGKRLDDASKALARRLAADVPRADKALPRGRRPNPNQ